MNFIGLFLLIILLAGAFFWGSSISLSATQPVQDPQDAAFFPKEITLPQKTQQSHSPLLSPVDVPSPKDRIPESNIHVYPDQVIVDINNAQWSRFTDTNSMDPVIDAGTNALQVVPQLPEDIDVGDIISYESEYGLIIHRVQEISHDEQGWYALVKGDNNPTPDPFKIRFAQIKRVVVGIIY